MGKGAEDVQTRAGSHADQQGCHRRPINCRAHGSRTRAPAGRSVTKANSVRNTVFIAQRSRVYGIVHTISHRQPYCKVLLDRVSTPQPPHPPRRNLATRKHFIKMVGARGFEPPTPWSRTRCATRLRYAPKHWKKVCQIALARKQAGTWEIPARLALQPLKSSRLYRHPEVPHPPG